MLANSMILPFLRCREDTTTVVRKALVHRSDFRLFLEVVVVLLEKMHGQKLRGGEVPLTYGTDVAMEFPAMPPELLLRIELCNAALYTTNKGLSTLLIRIVIHSCIRIHKKPLRRKAGFFLHIMHEGILCRPLHSNSIQIRIITETNNAKVRLCHQLPYPLDSAQRLIAPH